MHSIQEMALLRPAFPHRDFLETLTALETKIAKSLSRSLSPFSCPQALCVLDSPPPDGGGQLVASALD